MYVNMAGFIAVHTGLYYLSVYVHMYVYVVILVFNLALKVLEILLMNPNTNALLKRLAYGLQIY